MKLTSGVSGSQSAANVLPISPQIDTKRCVGACCDGCCCIACVCVLLPPPSFLPHTHTNRSTINRYGFNSAGAEAAAAHLDSFWSAAEKNPDIKPGATTGGLCVHTCLVVVESVERGGVGLCVPVSLTCMCCCTHTHSSTNTQVGVCH